MTKQRGLDATIRQFDEFAVNPTAPLGSVHSLDLAYQTQALAFKERASSMSFVFHSPPDAPDIRLNVPGTVDTLIKFENGTTSTRDMMEVGWLAHPNATRLRAIVYVGIADIDLPFSMAMQTKTLLPADAVSTITGELTACVPNQRMLKMGVFSWPSFDPLRPLWSFGVCSLDVEPDYPADRTKPFCVSIFGQWNTLSGADPSIAKDRQAIIFSMRMWDIIDPPNPES